MDVTAGGSWGTSPSPSNASSAVNNQGHNMQNGNNQNSTSGCDSTTSSRASLPSSAASAASISSGWGVGITSTSGAQGDNGSGLPTVPSSSAFNWQSGINFLQQNKTQAASSESTSGWGDSSVMSSVNSQGISSTDKSGSDSDKSFGGSKSGTGIDGQWGANISSNLRGPTGWDTGSGERNSPKPGGSGWGSPIPSPNPNAGTEAWGTPESKAGPSSGGWGQSTGTSNSAWGQPNNQAESVSSSSSWGDQSDQRSTGWGETVERRSNPSPNPSAWGAPQQKQTTGWDTPEQSTGWGAPTTESKSSVPWSQPDQSKLVSSAWGTGTKPSAPQQGWGGGAVNPPTSQWGSQSNSSVSGSTSTNTNASQHPQGAWGSGNPFGGGKASQPSSSSQFPTSWAQAAGKGLNPSSCPKPPMPSAQSKQEDMLQKAVTSHEGWGKRPVKQDTAWDVDDAPNERKNSGAASSGSSDDGKESNHWNANNDGTAIWEATKSSAASNWGNNGSSGNGGASGSRDRDDWGSDNDSGTWNGPPGSNSQSSSNWGDSPAPSNATNHNQWGSANSNTSWANNDRNNPKAYGNANVMNSGSNNWGNNGGGGGDNGQWGPPKPPQGQWENKPAGIHQWGNQTSAPPPPNQWAGHERHEQKPPNQWGAHDSRGPPPNQWGGGDNRGPTSQWAPNDTRGPPPNQWGGGGVSGGGDWSGNPIKDDNVWDKNGTNMWGEPGKAPPPPMPDNGHWGGGSGSGKSSSTSSWDDNIEPTGWDDGANSQNQKRRSSDVDDGTSAWGDPNSTSKPSNWGAQPPPGRPPQAITGRPDEKGPWSQPPPQMGKPPNWGGGGGADIGMFGGAPNRAGSWGDNNQWGGPAGARPKGGPQPWGDPAEQWNPKKGPNTYGGMGGKQQPTQMRAKMLQQLMDMGFKKDDAQNALIRNDMDLESAIADLVASAAKRHAEDRHFDKGHKDLSDMPQDANQFMNPLQAAYSNQSQVITNHMSHAPPSLPSASSLPSLNNPAINATLQQKILQQQMAQGGPPPQGQPIRGQVNPTPQSVQQQIVQRQIVQQLKVAVQAGLISPQLLTQQLTPATLVMLQQLLQLQSVLQRLVAQQNQVFLTQSKNMAPLASKGQLEQLSVMIQKIKEQIHQQQQQINQAQMHLTKGVPPKMEGVKDLAASMAGMGLNNVPPPAPPNQMQQQVQQQHQQQSRLSQWKLPSPDQMTSDSKAPGARPGLHQSLSTPDLPSTGGLSSLTDSTWSTTLTSSSREWPTISAPSSSGGDSDGGKEGMEKESQLPASSESQASASSASSNSSGNSNYTDMIEEFVPGKPWQGIAKNVEDDPFITPGSVNRSSLSVNTIRDDYLSSLGKSTTSPLSGEGNATWSSSYGAVGSKSKSTWSTSSAGDQHSDLWSTGQGKNTRPPPGLASRSMSMPVGDRPHAGRDRGQNQPISNTLILKNLTPQIDGSTLKTLCMQHGPLVAFHLHLAVGQAIVRYNAKEEAMKAQKSLNTCVLGNTTILAEFLSDAEIPQVPSSESSTPGINTSGSSSSLSDLWSHQSNAVVSSAFRTGSGGGNKLVEPNQWNGSSTSIGSSGSGGMWSGAAGLWGSSGFEDHSLLPGDLLGGQQI